MGRLKMPADPSLPGEARRVATTRSFGRRARRPQDTMARQDANEQFLATSFLDGANAAYIEQLYAKYEANPASVGEE